VLRDVAHPRLEVHMVGDRAAIPLAIGPTGLAGLTWANGECEAARAARDFGIPFCLSTMSICSIEDVAEATGTPFWFQLYLMKSRKVNESLLRRAHDAGCAALVPTLDLRVQGKRWAVFFDGGIRTGADIVKAMGCGADACLTGRGYLYGLAARGYGGVKRALELLRDELRDCMALCGLNDVAAIPEGVVTGPSG
jgi:isopentenyl diphosphate isomerase/L-lactate dehydrogenase-like FMN-dependent dehydrogenase